MLEIFQGPLSGTCPRSLCEIKANPAWPNSTRVPRSLPPSVVSTPLSPSLPSPLLLYSQALCTISFQPECPSLHPWKPGSPPITWVLQASLPKKCLVLCIVRLQKCLQLLGGRSGRIHTVVGLIVFPHPKKKVCWSPNLSPLRTSECDFTWK